MRRILVVISLLSVACDGAKDTSSSTGQDGALDDRVAVLETDVQGLQTSITDDLNLIKGYTDQVETELAGLGTTATAIDTAVDANGIALADLQTVSDTWKAGGALSQTLNAIAADVAATRTTVASIEAAQSSLQADINTLRTDIDIIKTAVQGSATPSYSVNCQDWSTTNWASEYECLHDGRWHLYFTMDDTGRTDQGGLATMDGFHLASRNGADSKIRLGVDWYRTEVVARVFSDSSFSVSLIDMPFLVSFRVEQDALTGLFTHADGAYSSQYNDSLFRTSTLGSRGGLMFNLVSIGNFPDLSLDGGVEFWARY